MLEHIGRYRISVLRVIAELFFAGDESRASGALGKLQRAEKIQIRAKKIDNLYSYYQLTKLSCEELGFSIDRAKALAELPLERDLGVLWFTTMNSRKRAKARSLPAAVETVAGNTPHVIELLSEAKGRFLHVQVPAADKDHRYPLKRIQAVIDQLQSTDDGDALLRKGVYGFAILVHHEERRQKFEQAFKKAARKLPKKLVLHIEVVPSPSDYRRFLN